MSLFRLPIAACSSAVSVVLSLGALSVAAQEAPRPAAATATGTEALAPATVGAAPAGASGDNCRTVSDRAMAVDMKIATAPSQKLELTEQARLYDDAVSLWGHAILLCEGRAKERAARALADNRKQRADLGDKLGSGADCAASHRDANALQELARQALTERRWTDASALFRKAENVWDVASERCTGPMQETASRRREQSEIDGHNSEHCAPLFEKAREQTQKLRNQGAGMAREERQELSQVAETLWRDALNQCKGTVLDLARNNAQALARERGTPWVARSLTPGVTPSASGSAATSASSGAARPLTPGGVVGSTTALAARPSAVLGAPPGASLGAALPVTLSTPHTAAAPATARQEAGIALPGMDITTDQAKFKGAFTREPDSTAVSGNGSIEWVNGDKFQGQLVKGARQGRGVFIWASGQRYEGDWVDDRATGRGKLHFANGNDYEGEVVNGLPQGQGRMQYRSGDVYTGLFQQGEPDVRGRFVWANGQVYDGEWKNRAPNGVGRLEFESGNRYDGAVRDGKPHGRGRMAFAGGATYDGDFAQGEPDGLGLYRWPSGDQYSGQWKAGRKHGEGEYQWPNGDRWKGRYDNDAQTEHGELIRKPS